MLAGGIDQLIPRRSVDRRNWRDVMLGDPVKRLGRVWTPIAIHETPCCVAGRPPLQRLIGDWRGRGDQQLSDFSGGEGTVACARLSRRLCRLLLAVAGNESGQPAQNGIRGG